VLFCPALPVDVSGFGFGAGNGAGTGSHNRFVHNTVYQFGATSNWGEEGVGVVLGVGRTATTANEVQNNLVFGARNGAGGIDLYRFDQTTAAVIRSNDWVTDSGPAVTDGPSGAYVNLTVAQFQAGAFDAATVVAANVQLQPAVTGGGLPSGLDAALRPNTDYFKLTDASPASVRQTGNPIRGDAVHGYNADPNKFASDITGRPRTAWSMGAYED
jgi:hypothetical protein